MKTRAAAPVAIATALLLSACSPTIVQSDDEPTEETSAASAEPIETEPTTETAEDLMILGGIGLGPGAIIPDMPIAGSCTAHSQYTDIKEGVQVSIVDASDTVVVIGKLEAGQLVDGDCLWYFDIATVPAGGGFYSAKVLNWQSDVVPEASYMTFVVDPTK
ncbi:hypothetical protein H1Q78_00165 [Cellulosimicrobium cellulans]|uniref:hypothetical protein n=1 Tax=Cellulosimicrobium cellulans TaxID=1710 RepID=UPI001EDBE977|nr:hypothetical protein [Cellulosimicrobium cellulans]UKJ63955.1 hypothetical protein H1Q78_00165 [Cellulosimicrobium cellulans]